MSVFNWHLLKVVLGFCGVIVLGLISLVFIDSLKEKETATTQVPIVETQASIKPTVASPNTTKSTSIPKTKTPVKPKSN